MTEFAAIISEANAINKERKAEMEKNKRGK